MSDDQADDGFDASVLDELRRFLGAANDEMVTELIALFFQEARSHLAEMRAALLHGDSETLARAAHRLHGSAGYLGARGVMDVCADIERLANERMLTGMDQLLGTLQSLIESLRRRLLA